MSVIMMHRDKLTVMLGLFVTCTTLLLLLPTTTAQSQSFEYTFEEEELSVDIDASRPPTPPPPVPPLVFSTAFTNNAVFQRGDGGVSIYGFSTTASPIKVTVQEDADGVVVEGTSYTVDSVVTPWHDTSGCNSTKCVYPSTQPMPAHRNFVWQATLKPQPMAGGNYTIVVAESANTSNSISMTGVTYGDVYFCSGQSNMALELYYT